MFISSRANPLIKQIRQLRQRKFREQNGLFYIEGIRLVIEALSTGAEIETLIVAPNLLTSHYALTFLQNFPHITQRTVEVTAEVFKSFALKDNPQGLAAVVKTKWSSIRQVEEGSPRVCLALNEIQDPGNLGSIIRTADAVGITNLILLGNCTDPYDPISIRASMGAVFTRQFIKMSFKELSDWASRKRYQVIGASGEAKVNYRAVNYRDPLILLMGSEQHGLSIEQQSDCDLLVSIPMRGRSDSLNLAIATSIILYEVFAQQDSRFPSF